MPRGLCGSSAPTLTCRRRGARGFRCGDEARGPPADGSESERPSLSERGRAVLFSARRSYRRCPPRPEATGHVLARPVLVLPRRLQRAESRARGRSMGKRAVRVLSTGVSAGRRRERRCVLPEGTGAGAGCIAGARGHCRPRPGSGFAQLPMCDAEDWRVRAPGRVTHRLSLFQAVEEQRVGSADWSVGRSGRSERGTASDRAAHLD